MHDIAKASLSIQHVKFMTTLSRSQIYAMEDADMFPKRRPVSRTRGLWYRHEICAWMQHRVDARRQANTRQSIQINAADRFITKHELIALVAITEPSFLPAEQAGLFPERIQISNGRVAWLHREVIDWINTRRNTVLPQRSATSSIDNCPDVLQGVPGR